MYRKLLSQSIATATIMLAAQSQAVSAQVLINEVDADQNSTDSAEFIELYDGGTGNTDLSGLSLVLYNGSDDLTYKAFDLDGLSTNEEGYFVLCGNAATVANCDLDVSPNTNLVQNGPDAVVLLVGDAADYTNDKPLPSDGDIVDAIVYDTSDGDDAALLVLLNPGQPQVNEGGNGSQTTESNQRCDNGAGGLRNTDTYIQAAPSPGASNTCPLPVVVTECGDPATPIHDVQGNGDSSPMIGLPVSIEAVVVGDFRGSTGLQGFFLQEEDSDQDADPATSEGLFVYEGYSVGTPISMGDRVHVAGRVKEFGGLTELAEIAGLSVCASGAIATPASVTFPLTDTADLEQVEGMAVEITNNTLTVTEVYSLGRYGQLGLASGGRLMNPTQVAMPGDDANAVGDANDLRRIVLDDGRSAQNPEVVPYPAPELSATNSVRVGDEVASLAGVLAYGSGAYRLHPTTAEPVFIPTNPRTAAPDLDNDGSLKVASFNVLNYFNGVSGFPTERGADSASEFDRQRDKIINALVAMDADIVGLVEIENNGYGEDSAIQDLINGLGDAGLNYNFVDPGLESIGTDAIAVGFIYKPETIALNGGAAILDSSVDPDFIDTKNRPALAQSFSEVLTGASLTISVNHLKSKGSSCYEFKDYDNHDGQGNCNGTRTKAATALVNWLAIDPTGNNDDNVLIIGDLNAYAMEDPITAIQDGGYTNLVKTLSGDNAYSYVFSGESGNLDHALSSDSLTSRVTGISEWHINADEPIILDYNEEYQSAEQQLKYYSAGPYRASDHDPLIIELGLFPIIADFNEDETINKTDFKLLQAQLNTYVDADNEKFDLNGDGRITGLDVAAWKNLWKIDGRAK